MRAMFAELGAGAGSEAGLAAAQAEVRRQVTEIAVRAGAKAAREALLAMASRGKVRTTVAFS